MTSKAKILAVSFLFGSVKREREERIWKQKKKTWQRHMILMESPR